MDPHHGSTSSGPIVTGIAQMRSGGHSPTLAMQVWSGHHFMPLGSQPFFLHRSVQGSQAG
jgi:hypothetical protein